jgi:hypothetical protein
MDPVMALICRSCRATLPDEARFCLHCAAPTTDAIKVGGNLVPQAARASTPPPREDHGPAEERTFEPPTYAFAKRPARSGGTGFRVAVMILSLVLMLVVGAQSCFGVLAGGITQNQGIAQGSSVGVLVAFLFLLGGALALPVPTVSMAIFLIAGIFGLFAGATTPFHDLSIWGAIAFVLAFLSYLGRGRRPGNPRDRSGAQRAPYAIAGGIVLVLVYVLISGQHGTTQSTGSTANAGISQQGATVTAIPSVILSPTLGALGTQSDPYPMTSDVVVGDAKWKILRVGTPAILSPPFGAPKPPQGKYVVVAAQVENLGKQMKSVTNLKLVDSQGRQFTAVADILQVQPPQVTIVHNINPNMPYAYSTVFDLPTDATGLMVTVSDLAALAPHLAYVSLQQ